MKIERKSTYTQQLIDTEEIFGAFSQDSFKKLSNASSFVHISPRILTSTNLASEITTAANTIHVMFNIFHSNLFDCIVCCQRDNLSVSYNLFTMHSMFAVCIENVLTDKASFTLSRCPPRWVPTVRSRQTVTNRDASCRNSNAFIYARQRYTPDTVWGKNDHGLSRLC